MLASLYLITLSIPPKQFIRNIQSIGLILHSSNKHRYKAKILVLTALLVSFSSSAFISLSIHFNHELQKSTEGLKESNTDASDVEMFPHP